MNVLLDTHALLWWLGDDRRLTKTARATIADPENTILVSAVSAWEIAIKKALGRLSAPDDLADQMRSGGLSELPITIPDGILAGALPRHHDDPFDRMLVAQAQRNGLTVMTRDPAFPSYGVTGVKA
ncbi:MAG TPA: type II toxin-antitoxin system VapC family toxin [Candidatus Dormibacteraeota bacterium]|nr:type II toxin-antitoxin system VapC family toxin [Candidatus Dormibacteraeota bacterium]